MRWIPSLVVVCLLAGCTEYVLGSRHKDDDDEETDTAEEFVEGEPGIQLSDQGLTYGNVNVGCPDVKTITVSNKGSGTLVLDGVTIDGDPDFALQPEAKGQLQPGEAQQFNVFFEPQIGGQRAADLELQSNDPDEGDGVLSVKGTAIDIAVVTDKPTQNNSGTNDTFDLSRTPIDINTLEVKVNTTIPPASSWRYVTSSNSVQFTSQLPPANATVHLTYEAAVNGCE